MAKVFVFRAVGVTVENRQELIHEYPRKGGAPVILVEEPTNPYDPLAIAVLNERGEKLGYVGRNDVVRPTLYLALGMCEVHARATRIGGFVRKDGSKASYGLEVEFCCKLMKDADNPSTPFRSVNSGKQKQKEVMVTDWKKHDRSKKTLSKLRDYARFDDSLDCLGVTKKIRRAIEEEDEVFFRGNRYAKMRSKYLGTSKFRWYESLAQHAWEIENGRRISKSGVKGGESEC